MEYFNCVSKIALNVSIKEASLLWQPDFEVQITWVGSPTCQCAHFPLSSGRTPDFFWISTLLSAFDVELSYCPHQMLTHTELISIPFHCLDSVLESQVENDLSLTSCTNLSPQECKYLYRTLSRGATVTEMNSNPC